MQDLQDKLRQYVATINEISYNLLYFPMGDMFWLTFASLLFSPPAIYVTVTGRALSATTVRKIFLNVPLTLAYMEPPAWRESTSITVFAGQVQCSSTLDLI